jgi:DegV family protein with EDD domain
MNKIAIVVASSTSLTQSDAKQLNILVAPLSINVHGKEHADLVDIFPEDIVRALEAKDEIKTSQPNLGLLDVMFKQLKADNYDHIFVYSIAGHLSGTYQAFNLAASSNDITNITIIDSLSACGPIRQMAIATKKLNEEGKSVKEIEARMKQMVETTVTYILPENLDQLVRGGRVKGSTAALSSLLKIKLCLYLDSKTTAIEKFATERSEFKLYNTIYADMLKRGVDPKTHIILIPGTAAEERSAGFKKFLLEKDAAFEIIDLVLPAGIAAHTGLGTFGVQAVLK